MEAGKCTNCQSSVFQPPRQKREERNRLIFPYWKIESINSNKSACTAEVIIQKCGAHSNMNKPPHTTQNSQLHRHIHTHHTVYVYFHTIYVYFHTIRWWGTIIMITLFPMQHNTNPLCWTTHTLPLGRIKLYVFLWKIAEAAIIAQRIHQHTKWHAAGVRKRWRRRRRGKKSGGWNKYIS